MKQKMDCHKAQKICHGLFFGGLACMLLALLGGQVGAGPLVFLLGIPGMLASFGGLLFGYVYVRCPHCGGSLTQGRLPSVPDYCPHCGEKLKEDKEEE